MTSRRGFLLAGLSSLAAASPDRTVRAHETSAVVATGVLRPLQLIPDGDALIVLSPGLGDSAGELHRFIPPAAAPVDLSRQRAIKVPYGRPAGTTLGSLVRHPETGALFMGEENGTRLWRLERDERVTLYGIGLRRLAGGGSLAVDGAGRLIVLDHADPYVSRPEESLPPGLEQLRLEEDHRGPLVYRLAVDAAVALPRRVDHVPPYFPRPRGGRAVPLPDFTSVAALATGVLLLLASSGALHTLAPDGALTLFTRLPGGQYTRTHMVVGADGAAYVSGGFHVGQVFRVSSAAHVETIASNLADPGGIALDAHGRLYVAECARHRVLRLRSERT
jgi:hypothetical protein